MTPIHDVVRTFLQDRAHCFISQLPENAGPLGWRMMVGAGYKDADRMLRDHAKHLARSGGNIPQWIARYLADPPHFTPGARHNHLRDEVIRSAVDIALKHGAMTRERAYEIVADCIVVSGLGSIGGDAVRKIYNARRTHGRKK